MVLKLCADVSPAEWITGNVDSWNDMALFGPAGFEAYARLRFMPDPAYKGQRASEVSYDSPDSDEDLLARLCALLTSETTTKDDCFFALWEGHGDLESPRLEIPRMRIPNRGYYLFRGPLSEVGNWEMTRRRGTWPAAFVWPADHAWCIASDTDPYWAGIGASRHAINLILAHQHLDVVAADRQRGGPFYM